MSELSEQELINYISHRLDVLVKENKTAHAQRLLELRGAAEELKELFTWVQAHSSLTIKGN